MSYGWTRISTASPWTGQRCSELATVLEPPPAAEPTRTAPKSTSTGAPDHLIEDARDANPASTSEVRTGDSLGAFSDQPWKAGARVEPLPCEEFDGLWDGLDLDGLELAHLRLRRELTDSISAAHRSRLELGLYVERSPEPVDLDGDGTPNPRPMVRIETGADDPSVQVHGDVAPDGSPIGRITWLPVEEYPDLYRRQQELRCLAIRLAAARGAPR